MNSARHIILIILLFCLLIPVFYPRRAFNRGFSASEDILVHEIPLAAFLVKSVRQGSFPFWDPYKACGIPAFEISFMGPFYPAVLLYFLLPPDWAINYGFLIHIFLSGVFMFLLGREFRFNRLVAFFCAVSWIFSSIFQHFSNAGWLAQTISAAYLPGLVYCFIRTVKTSGPEKRIFGLLAGLLTALMITGGVPHYSALIAYCLVFFFLPFLGRPKVAVSLLLIFSAGLLISIVYWGPVALQLQGALIPARLGQDLSGYSLVQLKNIVLPDYAERGFAGRAVLLLGLLGIFLPGPYAKNLRWLFVISLILMFSHTEIMGFRLISYLPFVNKDRNVWPWHTGWIFSLVLFSGIGLQQLSRRFSRRRSARVVILGAVIALQLADLYIFSQRETDQRGDDALEEYFSAAPLVEFFRQDGSLFRISNELYDFAGFRTNQGLWSGISCFESRIRGLNGYRFTGENSTHYYLEEAPGGLLRDLCNIKYVIARGERDDPGLDRVGEIADMYIYRNDSHYPRAFLIEGVSKDRVEEVLLQNYSGTLLTMAVGGEARDLLADYFPVEIKWEPDRYQANVRSDRGGLLFLSEMFSSGWGVRIDGVAACLVTPFNFFMAVFVPPGRHSVTFQFRPVYFYVCAAISAAGLIIWLLLFLHYLRRRSADSLK